MEIINLENIQLKESNKDYEAIRKDILKHHFYPLKFFKTNTKIFDKTNESDRSEFELILTSNEDNSAIISLVLREFETENFWTVKIDFLNVMKHYAENSDPNFLNLFSILIFNWHDHSGIQRNYHLVKKFEVFEQVSGGVTLFDKIFGIIDNDSLHSFHSISLMIIYYYFDEINQSYDIFDANPKVRVFEDLYMGNLITRALTIKNIEYRLGILKILVAFLRNPKSEHYNIVKESILTTFESYFDFISICKVSYSSIARNCDGKYFQLVFLLKESKLSKFKTEFEIFKEIHKQYYGEFWTHAIRFNAQLLYNIAKNHRLVDTQEFILLSTKILEHKHSITSIFRDYAEFQTVFNEPLEKDEQKLLKELTNFIINDFIVIIDDYEYFADISKFTKLFKNSTKIRKLFFGRKNLRSESLFEHILRINKASNYEVTDNAYILDYIWNEFLLWDKPEILVMKNPLGKSLFDYVLETRNDFHLISFLMPKPSDSLKSTSKPRQFMMLKNSLFFDSLGYENAKCLIEYHFDLIDKNNGSDPENLQNLFYLFEEISEYNSEQQGKSKFVREIFERVENEESENFDGKNELKLPRKHFLIGIMMIYWIYEAKLNKITFLVDKSETNDHGTLFFKLLFYIINGKDKEFHHEFPIEMEKLENCFKNIYKLESTYDNKHQQEDTENVFHFYEKYSANFIFVLLYAAIKTKHTKIIEQIFNYDHFLITIPTFPSNMEPNEAHFFTTLKFLENKYELGRGAIPINWTTYEVLLDFLNSRISSYGGFYKIDCRFMLPYYNHDATINSSKEVGDDLIFNEDYDTMEYIINNYELKPLVTHPVLGTIINVKIEKYSQIFQWERMAFILFYILPTLFLVLSLHPRLDEHDMEYFLVYFCIIIRPIFIVAKEVFLYNFTNRMNYFNSKMNLITLGLAILPIFMLIGIIIYNLNPTPIIYGFLTIMEIANILFMIPAMAYTFSNQKFSILVICFKKIFETYTNIFINFLPLFLGVSAIAYIILNGSSAHDILSHVILYSGIPFINNQQVNGFLQGIALTMIVILVINKMNLVLSITIHDIQTIMDHAKMESLISDARKYVNFAKAIRIFYAINENDENLSFSKKMIFGILRLFLRKYPFVHRLQTLYIDKSSHNVYVNAETSVFEPNYDKIFQSLINFLSFRMKASKINFETMEEIKKIVKKSLHTNDKIQ